MPGENILILDASNFKETISQGVTVVDFWAAWCGPCRMLNPILEKIAGKMSHKAKICKLNIDENPDISVEYNVMSIPAVFIYKDGQVVNRLFGIRTEEELVEAIISSE